MLGTPSSISLKAGEQRLYKVIVPAGQTMRVSLTGQSDGLQNELFLKWDGVPSGADFDAAYETPLAASQSALISSTEPGTYYILVRSTGTDAPAENFTLLAEILPSRSTFRL